MSPRRPTSSTRNMGGEDNHAGGGGAGVTTVDTPLLTNAAKADSRKYSGEYGAGKDAVSGSTGSVEDPVALETALDRIGTRVRHHWHMHRPLARSSHSTPARTTARRERFSPSRLPCTVPRCSHPARRSHPFVLLAPDVSLPDAAGVRRCKRRRCIGANGTQLPAANHGTVRLRPHQPAERVAELLAVHRDDRKSVRSSRPL